jgi:hypothetical protein
MYGCYGRNMIVRLENRDGILTLVINGHAVNPPPEGQAVVITSKVVFETMRVEKNVSK